jgi:hypothetical protein
VARREPRQISWVKQSTRQPTQWVRSRVSDRRFDLGSGEAASNRCSTVLIVELTVELAAQQAAACLLSGQAPEIPTMSLRVPWGFRFKWVRRKSVESVYTNRRSQGSTGNSGLGRSKVPDLTQIRWWFRSRQSGRFTSFAYWALAGLCSIPLYLALQFGLHEVSDAQDAANEADWVTGRHPKALAAAHPIR